MNECETMEHALANETMPDWVERIAVHNTHDGDGELAFTVAIGVNADRAYEVVQDAAQYEPVIHALHHAAREINTDRWPYPRFLSMDEWDFAMSEST